MITLLAAPKLHEMLGPLDWIPAAIMGVVLVVIGVGLMIWQSGVRRRQQADTTRSPEEAEFQQRQFRRRTQVSGLLILIGLMIPLGDFCVDWRARGPVAGTIFWISVLALTMWVALLGIGDLLSTRTRGRVSLSKLRQKQQALEQEVERLRAEARGEPFPRD
ncbi:MAG: hypothetical protein R3C01_07035 [Planctomycetaceae bacterium]